jgi:hypothetical protein
MARRKPFDSGRFAKVLEKALTGKNVPANTSYHVSVAIIGPGGQRKAAGIAAAGTRADADQAFEAIVTEEQTDFDIDG